MMMMKKEEEVKSVKKFFHRIIQINGHFESHLPWGINVGAGLVYAEKSLLVCIH